MRHETVVSSVSVRDRFLIVSDVVITCRRIVLFPASTKDQLFVATRVLPRYSDSEPLLRSAGVQARGRICSMRWAANVDATAERWPRAIIRVTRAAVLTRPS